MELIFILLNNTFLTSKANSIILITDSCSRVPLCHTLFRHFRTEGYRDCFPTLSNRVDIQKGKKSVI